MPEHLASVWVVALVTGVVTLLTWFLTGVVLRYVLAKGILDHPTTRSSHVTPTPRGGGVAIVATTLAATVVGTLLGWVTLPLCAALCGGGILIAWIGWRDDKHHVAPRWRVVVHGTAALVAMAVLGGLPNVHVGDSVVHLGPAGFVLGTLGIVWAINFYNFMDGIDGIATIEGVTVGFSATAILLASGNTSITFPALVIASACLGFLPWNWSPAKIFMGDVCSGFLGYWFAVLALASEKSAGPPVLAWILLLGIFVFDTTATLLVRLYHGKRVYDAHRTHSYQYAVALGTSHARVSAIVGVMTAAIGGVVWRTLHTGGSLMTAALGVAAVLTVIYIAVRWKHMLLVKTNPQSH